MRKLAGIKFRENGKIYFYDIDKINEKFIGKKVIVDTDLGKEIGEIVTIKYIDKELNIDGLKKIIRIATFEDLSQDILNKEAAERLFDKCKELIEAQGQNTKLLEVRYLFDKTKLICSFKSDERLEFKDLVKELAKETRSRIELRQISIKEFSKFTGDCGICGKELCCRTFLREIENVKAKHLKEQNITVQSNKNLGICGKIKCCMKYECESK